MSKGIFFKTIGIFLPAVLLYPFLFCCAPDVGNKIPYEIPVVVVKYFPVKGDNIDRTVTGDWGESLTFTRSKTDSLTRGIIRALESGSRYHGYKNPDAPASLKYTIVDIIEFIEPLPEYKKQGFDVPITDYAAIMNRINIRHWVGKIGVKEVWIWGYHGGVIHLWESNMAGPYGDISNSNRDTTDLPVLSKTYTVYHYNYQRGVSEAVENHMHQLEAVLNHVDGRDRTPEDEWDQLLYWGKFVGSDKTHKIVRPGCGWSHYPPNAERDYDWANKRYVLSNIMDWKPDGSGKKQPINCDVWGGNSLQWFIFWMQNHPGKENNVTYNNRPLTNWWMFIGAFDCAMAHNLTLVSQ